MLICKRTVHGPLAPVCLGDSILKWVTTTRLLGMTVDDRFTWVEHTLELKRSFAKRLKAIVTRYRQSDYVYLFTNNLNGI